MFVKFKDFDKMNEQFKRDRIEVELESFNNTVQISLSYNKLLLSFGSSTNYSKKVVHVVKKDDTEVLDTNFEIDKTSGLVFLKEIEPELSDAVLEFEQKIIDIINSTKEYKVLTDKSE